MCDHISLSNINLSIRNRDGYLMALLEGKLIILMGTIIILTGTTRYETVKWN